MCGRMSRRHHIRTIWEDIESIRVKDVCRPPLWTPSSRECQMNWERGQRGEVLIPRAGITRPTVCLPSDSTPLICLFRIRCTGGRTSARYETRVQVSALSADNTRSGPTRVTPVSLLASPTPTTGVLDFGQVSFRPTRPGSRGHVTSLMSLRRLREPLPYPKPSPCTRMSNTTRKPLPHALKALQPVLDTLPLEEDSDRKSVV